MRELRELVRAAKKVGIELPRVRKATFYGLMIDNVACEGIIDVQNCFIAILIERLKSHYNIKWTIKPSKEITDPDILESGTLSFTLPDGDDKTLEYDVIEWDATENIIAAHWSKGGVHSQDPDYVGDRWDEIINAIWLCFNSMRPYLHTLIIDNLENTRNYEYCKKYAALNLPEAEVKEETQEINGDLK